MKVIGTQLWAVESELVAGGVTFPLRMTIMGGSDGLVLWSPVAVDEETAAAIDALGPVRHIVAPNKLHHLHVAAAQTRWPKAKLWGARGLAEKRPDLNFDGLLPEATLPGVELVEIEGIPWMNEVVAFHPESGAVLVTDLVFSIREAKGMSAFVFRFVAGTLGRLGQSRLVRWKRKDQGAYDGSVERLWDWDFDILVPAHGQVVQGDAKAQLRQALS